MAAKGSHLCGQVAKKKVAARYPITRGTLLRAISEGMDRFIKTKGPFTGVTPSDSKVKSSTAASSPSSLARPATPPRPSSNSYRSKTVLPRSERIIVQFADMLQN